MKYEIWSNLACQHVLVEGNAPQDTFVKLARSGYILGTELETDSKEEAELELTKFKTTAVSARPLSLDAYQVYAERTAGKDLSFTLDLAVCALGLAGEAGEVADLIKKVVGHGHPLDEATKKKLAKELGDVAWYLAVVSLRLGFPLSHVCMTNVEKLRARYPEGFSTERSLNRAPEDVLELAGREAIKRMAQGEDAEIMAIPPKPEPPPNRVFREGGTEICNESPRSGGITHRQYSCSLKKGHASEHRDEYHGNMWN